MLTSMGAGGADAWDVPGRPSHPDFWVLSDLVLQGGAVAVEGTEDLFEQAQRTTEVDLVAMAQDEARNLT